jgi:hypothetical protein
MAIIKRSRNVEQQVILRHFYLEDEQRIVTKQQILTVQVRNTATEPEALVDGVWCEAAPIDALQRGGCHYEIYLPKTL